MSASMRRSARRCRRLVESPSPRRAERSGSPPSGRLAATGSASPTSSRCGTRLTTQPVPKGQRVGIVTNVGGPAILCADACEANGLVIADLTPETAARLRPLLPAEASVGNPVDMLAAGTADQYRQAITFVASDP